MKKSNKFLPEVRERAVSLMQEHRGKYPSVWEAIEFIATEAQRVKELERDNKELRSANEILKLARSCRLRRQATGTMRHTSAAWI